MPRQKPYDTADRAFPISRTGIEEFVTCPRCFYQRRRLQFKRPFGPMSKLPNVVDELLKREFDAYRARQEAHPVMRELPGDLVPFQHTDLDTWRENFKGVRAPHAPSGFVVSGAVDDLWIDRSSGDIHVVDYKTSTKVGPITAAGPNYGRQAEVYQWLLRENGFAVSDTAFFVFQQPDQDAPGLEQVLRFEATIVAHRGRTDWIEQTLLDARACLDLPEAPAASPECDLCAWVANASR